VDLMQSDACSGKDGCEMEKFRMEVFKYYQPPFSSVDCEQGALKVAYDGPPSVVGSDEKYLKLLNGLTGGLAKYCADHFVSVCKAKVVGASYAIMSSVLSGTLTRPFERDWEIFAPGQNAQAALKIAKDYFKLHKICLPLIGVFIRFAAPEDGTLIAHTVSEGPFSSGPPGMFFEMPVLLPKGMKCADQARYEKVYADLAELMLSSPINGRAHWGKNRSSLFQLQRRPGTYGDNMTQFREVVAETDPTGMFANEFGVDMGLRWPQLQSAVPPHSDTAGCTP
jgi:hypothetical protein